jgi:cytochrome b subunit of formate dehydrogenase
MSNSAPFRMHVRRFGRICGWVTMILALITLLTGYGITQYRIVDPLTLGILNKALAQRLHAYTDLPFLVLMVTHVGIALWWRITASNPKEMQK